MAVTKYQYTISTQTMNGLVNITRLTSEIAQNATITTVVVYMDSRVEADKLDIYMEDALTAPEEAALDAVVAAHTGEPVLVATSTNMSYIYKPGAADSGPTVYGNWADMQNAIDDMRDMNNGEGLYEITVDDSITSPAVIPVANPTTGAPDGAFTVAGTTVTLTNSLASFTADLVGRYITIAGATTPANNGTFRITGVPSAVQLEYENAAGVAEAQGAATYSITTPWNLKNTTIRGFSMFTSCDIADGVTFLGMRHIASIFISSLSVAPSPPLCTDFNTPASTIVVEGGAIVNAAGGGVPVWDTSFGDAGLNLGINLVEGQLAQNPAAGSPVIHLGLAGQTGLIRATAQGGIWRNGFSSVVGTTAYTILDPTSLWGLQQNFLGTLSETVRNNGPVGNVNPIPPAAAKVAAVNMSFDDDILRCDVSGGGYTQTLPSLPQDNSVKGTCRRIMIKEESGSPGLLVGPAGGNTIEGSATPVEVPPGGAIIFIADGVSNWLIRSVYSKGPFTIDLALVVASPDALSKKTRLARYNTTAGIIVANLPAANTFFQGEEVTVKNEVGANNVNVTPNGADTIDSVAAVFPVGPGAAYQFVSDGISNWTAV